MRPTRETHASAGSPPPGLGALTKDGRVIVPGFRMARTFLDRFRGLMGQRALTAGQGMYFPRCRVIHTCFMRFALDLVFLDKDQQVVRIVRDVHPWRVAKGPRQATSVLEVASGRLANSALREGDRVEIGPAVQPNP